MKARSRAGPGLDLKGRYHRVASYPFHGEGRPCVIGEKVDEVVVGRKNGDGDSCEDQEQPKQLALKSDCLKCTNSGRALHYEPFFNSSEEIMLKSFSISYLLKLRNAVKKIGGSHLISTRHWIHSISIRFELNESVVRR